jgi:hypothetical protein
MIQSKIIVISGLNRPGPVAVMLRHINAGDIGAPRAVQWGDKIARQPL